LGILFKNMKAQRKTRYFGLTNFQIAMSILLALADAGLVIILISLLEIDVKTLTVYYAFTLLIFTFISAFRITRFGGAMKRGIPIWRENLPKNMAESLRYMWQDVENDNGFIRIDGERRLVFAHYRPYRTAWPYVAYIDLGDRPPKIEYRTGLAGVLYLIPFFIGFSPFVVLMMGLNHFVERAAIRRFIVDNAIL
jgi:hypothetical protein